MNAHCSPLGVFDSGVGGLSVFRAIRALDPSIPVLYFADQSHVPYGNRPVEEIRQYSEGISRFLLEQGAAVLVVACNTASAAALHHLRSVFPKVPFVGMEPAVKPAAALTHSRVVGVLATPATFQGELYNSVVERFAGDVTLLQGTCPGLVQQIEKGELDTPGTRSILERAIWPMLTHGVDTIVLGCTHFPFVIPLIQQIAGANVQVIDPAPAVARQARRLLDLVPSPGMAPLAGGTQFFTSGPPEALATSLVSLLDCHEPVNGVRWEEGRIVLSGAATSAPGKSG